MRKKRSRKDGRWEKERRGSTTEGESRHAPSNRHHAPIRGSSRSTPTIAQYASLRVITLNHVHHESIHEPLKNEVRRPLFREVFTLRASTRIAREGGEKGEERERERKRCKQYRRGEFGMHTGQKDRVSLIVNYPTDCFFFFFFFLYTQNRKTRNKKKEREKTSYTIYRQQLQGLNAGPFRVVRREDISAFIYILSLFYFSFFFFRMCPVKKYKSKHG